MLGGYFILPHPVDVDVANQIDWVDVSSDVVEYVRQLGEEELWNRSSAVDDGHDAGGGARGNSDAKQLERVCFDAEVDVAQTNSRDRHRSHAAVVCRQSGGAGARQRAVDDLEPVGTESAEADRMGVMPCFNEKQHVDRQIMAYLEQIVQLVSDWADVVECRSTCTSPDGGQVVEVLEVV